jgi:hypothetical protein
MREFQKVLMFVVWVATANAFLAVGFSVQSGQTHDELESEFVEATKTE